MRGSWCVLAALWATPAFAVPFQFTSQGRVDDGTGSPLEGAHQVKFTLYDAQTGGASVWTETLSVEFDGGVYTAVLGRVTALDTDRFAGGAPWLALTIDQGAELPTRVALTSVPYALVADRATHLSGGAVDATSISVDGVEVIDADGNIGWSHLTDLPQLLSDLSCSTNQIPAWSGTRWECRAPSSTSASDLTTGTVDIARLPVGSDSDEVARGDHVHPADDLTSGVLAIGRIPVGTTSGTVASGVHSHDASAIGTGVLPVSRLPVGTDADDVAAGNHGHDGSAIVSGTVGYARLPVGTTTGTVAAGAHSHSASDLVGGTLSASVLPFGTSSTSVARGDHLHAYADLTGAVPFADLPVGTSSTTVARGDHAHAFSELSGTVPTDGLPFGTGHDQIARGDHGHDAGDIAGGLPAFDALIARFDLDEPAGTVLADTSGHGNDAVVVGSVGVGSPGHVGNAVAFSGGGLLVASGNGLKPSPRVTVDAWVNPTGVTGTQTVVEKQGEWVVRLEGNKVVFEVTTSVGMCAVTSTRTLTAGAWQAVGGWYNERDVAVRVGDATVTAPCEDGPLAESQGSQLTMGMSAAAAAKLTGRIDGVRIWGTAPESVPVPAYKWCRFGNPPDTGVGGNHIDPYDADLECTMTTTGRPLVAEWCMGVQQSGGTHGGTYIRLWVDGAAYDNGPMYWEYNNPNDNWHTNNCGRYVFESLPAGSHKIEIRPLLHACGSCTYYIETSHILLHEL